MATRFKTTFAHFQVNAPPLAMDATVGIHSGGTPLRCGISTATCASGFRALTTHLSYHILAIVATPSNAVMNSCRVGRRKWSIMGSTLKELSLSLGLSPSTISRALAGREPKRQRTRAQVERIRALATELGYEPNGLARSLKTRRRRIVGLILPDIMNDYYAAAATLVQATLAAEGFRVILCVTNDDPEDEAAQVRILREERVAGLVAVPSPRAVGAQRPSSAALDSLPVVELVRYSSGSTDAVLIDDVDAGRQGTQHLIDLGHRRIAVLTGPPNLNTSRLRLEGYTQALTAAGISYDALLVRSGPYRRDAARVATQQLLDGPDTPTALIATSNELVVGALQALAQWQIQVPHDLSLVGFGNPDWFALLRPALTTVALPIEEMAMTAVHLLLKRIRQSEAGEAAPEAPVISRYQAHLLVRDSTRAL